MTSLYEGGRLADAEKILPGIRSYPVRTLENASWRLDVVPEFDARVVRMIDKRAGRELLRRPALGEGHGVPDGGGLAISLHPDPHARKWDIAWTPAPIVSGDALVISGGTANGLQVRRTLRLGADVVHTETEVTNPGKEPVGFVVNARGDFDPVDIDHTLVVFRAQDGSSIEKRLVPAGEKPDGSQNWDGRQQPDGSWTVRAAQGEVYVWSRFDPAQAGRTYISWTAKSHPRVTLGVWSVPQNLKPGETCRIDVDYGNESR